MFKPLLSVFLFTMATTAQAKIYTTVDANGHVTISNRPVYAGKPIKLGNHLKTPAAPSFSNTVSDGGSGHDRFTYFYKYIDRDGTLYFTDKAQSNLTLLSKTKVKIHSNPVSGLMQTAYKVPQRRTWTFVKENKSRFAELIEQTAAKHQVDVRLVHAVIQTESAYDADAISPAGAVGLMQLMPETARRFGVENRQAPEQNIEGGIRYLRHLMNLFPNNLDLAVAAYNAGENAVMRHNNTIPPYPETMNYVRQVLALYNGQQ